MHEALPNLAIVWAIQLAGVLSPGPAVALLVGVATGQGRRAALLTAFGMALAGATMAAIAVAGLAAVLADMQAVMLGVRIAGVLYLAWLAVQAFRRAAAPPELAAIEPPPRPAARLVTGGWMLQISNPKAVVAWVLIAGIGGLSGFEGPVLALFVAGAFVISFSGHGAWALLLSTGAFRAAYRTARAWVEGALGAFFAVTAFKIATTTLE